MRYSRGGDSASPWTRVKTAPASRVRGEMTELQTTLHFHRKDRAVRHCGFSGKHPIYLLETTPGKRYLVRNASLKESAKSFGKATAVLAEKDVSGTDVDADRVRKIRWEGPAAEEARKFVIHRLRHAVEQWRKYADDSDARDAVNHERFEALARGEEIPMYENTSGEGSKIRMLAGTEPADGKIQIEAYYDSPFYDEKWERYQAKLARGEEPWMTEREPRVWSVDKYRETFDWQDLSEQTAEFRKKADQAEKLVNDLEAAG